MCSDQASNQAILPVLGGGAVLAGAGREVDIPIAVPRLQGNALPRYYTQESPAVRRHPAQLEPPVDPDLTLHRTRDAWRAMRRVRRPFPFARQSRSDVCTSLHTWPCELL